IDIKVIKIYGHSLSNADYVYFQSIFDFLNIYENPINIIVYYTKYKENEAEIRQELSNAVQKLISRYGQSMDNKEKGKNLLRKLLLENCLTIKKINLKEASKRRRFASTIDGTEHEARYATNLCSEIKKCSYTITEGNRKREHPRKIFGF
ncbi:TPA: hypothetical protein LWK99_002550, partial [Listeria innocua]|nr:hypothetical protein [Listeria innocua]